MAVWHSFLFCDSRPYTDDCCCAHFWDEVRGLGGCRGFLLPKPGRLGKSAVDTACVVSKELVLCRDVAVKFLSSAIEHEIRTIWRNTTGSVPRNRHREAAVCVCFSEEKEKSPACLVLGNAEVASHEQQVSELPWEFHFGNMKTRDAPR